jgi:hypothetical protein
MRDRRCPGPFRGSDPNGVCHQLLFRYSTDGWVEVKCPRCKTVTVTQVARLGELVSYAS